ncbi:uncharacterized protein K452DRAFT_343111 [Aplosporella prunicola CBS 121167]|uniref:Major facilitator superfamily (MFS) profile domain-containing protein n=1 Tax=Aplosporella prunicola CBS 121167 TaxID=1176127 RepID=A0A6A6AYY5_9PEZI|nr:uncharacterized protein K452DRAFT_343111 [Aplosporella prunicola CBS 121167]KAF2136478.1 hypothetical protein K452DRAFT_343111 [Aplosporella prunicola CBS 121167]
MSYDTEAGLPESQRSDSNIVDWDGQDDLNFPQNWQKSIRLGHVAVAGTTAFLSNIGSTGFAIAASSLAHEFHITNSTLETLTVTLYLLGFALGPLVIAPLSETYGRLPVYYTCLTCSIVFLNACAQAPNVAVFLVFRFITGISGSGPATIGGGTIADVMPKESRGGAMALYGLGPLMGPVIGPIINGFVVEHLNWRWIFRILSIATSIVTLCAVFFMRETYAPLLLQRKAARLRKETGNYALCTNYDKKPGTLQTLRRAIVRPIKMLTLSPIVMALSIFTAFVFGLQVLLITTFPNVYKEQYGWSQSISGLAYLGLGVGILIALVAFGMLSDKVVNARAKAKGEKWKPEGRFLIMMWFSPAWPIGFFWYGWAAYYSTHWILPIIGTAWIGFGSLSIMLPIQLYLVDAFGPVTAASALAANTVLRAFAACFLPLAGPKLYETLNLGWGNSLLGFLAVAFTTLPVIFFKYGELIRMKWPVEL